MEDNMFQLYLVKVPHNLGFDVLAYQEPECIRPVAHWPYNYSNRPDHRYKRVRVDCSQWQVVWIN